MLIAFPSLIFAIITLLIYFTYKSKMQAKLDDLEMELSGESENRMSFEAKYNQSISELKRYEELKKGKELDEMQLLFAKVNMLDDKITFLNSSFKNKLDTIISIVEFIKTINEDNKSLIKNTIVENNENEADIKENIDNSFNHIAEQDVELYDKKEEIDTTNKTENIVKNNQEEANQKLSSENNKENETTLNIANNDVSKSNNKDNEIIDDNKIFVSKKDYDIFDSPNSYDNSFLEENNDNLNEETEKSYEFNDVFDQNIQEKTDNTQTNLSSDTKEKDMIFDITSDNSSIVNELDDIKKLDLHESNIDNEIREKTINVENISKTQDTNNIKSNNDDCNEVEINNFIVDAQEKPFDNPKSCNIDILDKEKENKDNKILEEDTIKIDDELQKNNNILNEATNNIIKEENKEEIKKVVEMQNNDEKYKKDLEKSDQEEIIDTINSDYNDFPPAPDYVENNNDINLDNKKKQPITSVSNNNGFDIKESIEKLKAQLNESE